MSGSTAVSHKSIASVGAAEAGAVAAVMGDVRSFDVVVMVGGGGVGPLPPVATGGMDMMVMNNFAGGSAARGMRRGLIAIYPVRSINDIVMLSGEKRVGMMARGRDGECNILFVDNNCVYRNVMGDPRARLHTAAADGALCNQQLVFPSSLDGGFGVWVRYNCWSIDVRVLLFTRRDLGL